MERNGDGSLRMSEKQTGKISRIAKLPDGSLLISVIGHELPLFSLLDTKSAFIKEHDEIRWVESAAASPFGKECINVSITTNVTHERENASDKTTAKNQLDGKSGGGSKTAQKIDISSALLVSDIVASETRVWLKAFRREKITPNAVTENGVPLVVEALRQQRPDIALKLIEDGADTNSADKEGNGIAEALARESPHDKSIPATVETLNNARLSILKTIEHRHPDIWLRKNAKGLTQLESGFEHSQKN